MSSVHQNYPRFLCRLAVTERCAGAPAPLEAWGRVVGRAATRLAVALLAIGAPAACGDAGPVHEVGSDPSLRFEGAAPSLDDLGVSVLSALSSGDAGELDRFRLTAHEHNDVVWPELPASAPEVNFPIDYAWQNIQVRNRRGLDRILPLYADRDLTFQRVECRGPTERFATFEVMTDCWVMFEQKGDRTGYEAQIFKDVLARGGGYKVFRYYDEEPRRLAGARTG